MRLVPILSVELGKILMLEASELAKDVIDVIMGFIAYQS